jgi:hypothetical protein
MFVNRNYVYWAKVTQQLTLSHRYSQLVANCCCRLACSSPETFFSEICSWTDLFVMGVVCEPRFHCVYVYVYIYIYIYIYIYVRFCLRSVLELGITENARGSIPPVLEVYLWYHQINVSMYVDISDIYSRGATSNLDRIIDCSSDCLTVHFFKPIFGVISVLLHSASFLESILKYHLNNRRQMVGCTESVVKYVVNKHIRQLSLC